MVTENLPCVECCSLDLTCCHNPQILWTLEEVDNLFSNHPEVFENIALFKGEIVGTLYLIRLDDKTKTSVNLEYCSMYDNDNRRCMVYDSRPNICKTYGDPKYAPCPYDGYKEGELLNLVKSNPKLADEMHRMVGNNPQNYLEDFIKPWAERFIASKDTEEYYTWWENLPEANFIRN